MSDSELLAIGEIGPTIAKRLRGYALESRTPGRPAAAAWKGILDAIEQALDPPIPAEELELFALASKSVVKHARRSAFAEGIEALTA